MMFLLVKDFLVLFLWWNGIPGLGRLENYACPLQPFLDVFHIIKYERKLRFFMNGGSSKVTIIICSQPWHCLTHFKCSPGTVDIEIFYKKLIQISQEMHMEALLALISRHLQGLGCKETTKVNKWKPTWRNRRCSDHVEKPRLRRRSPLPPSLEEIVIDTQYKMSTLTELGGAFK
jgi:hypothetical protein